MLQFLYSSLNEGGKVCHALLTITKLHRLSALIVTLILRWATESSISSQSTSIAIFSYTPSDMGVETRRRALTNLTGYCHHLVLTCYDTMRLSGTPGVSCKRTSACCSP